MATIQNPIEVELYLVGTDEDDAFESKPFASLGEARSYVKNDAENENGPGEYKVYSVTAYIDPTTIEKD